MSEQEELERARLHFEDNLADVVRIADLERQLAEAQGKLDKVQAASDRYGYSHSHEFMDVIFAILSKEGE